jgi:hypothetical protein
MRAEITQDGKLAVDLYDMMSALDGEQKRKLADALACEDEIIADVTAQLLDGWTEAGSRGCMDDSVPEPRSPLEKARRAIALGAGAVAEQQIKSLAARVTHEAAYCTAYRDWGFRLYHAMYDAGMRPEQCPSWMSVERSQKPWAPAATEGGPAGE